MVNERDQHCLAREKQSYILWSLHAGVLSEVHQWVGRFSPAWNGNLALRAVVFCSLCYFLIGAEAREWASPPLRECLRVSVSTGSL